MGGKQQNLLNLQSSDGGAHERHRVGGMQWQNYAQENLQGQNQEKTA